MLTKIIRFLTTNLREQVFLSFLLFFIFGLNFNTKSQESYDRLVNESNTLIYEKFKAEEDAIDEFMSKYSSKLTSRSVIDQSGGNSSARSNLAVTSECDFIKRKPTTYEYRIRDDGKLIITSTIYGSCSKVKKNISDADIDVKVMNENDNEHPNYDKSSYIVNINSRLISKVDSDKDLYLTIFMENSNSGDVTVVSPLYPNENKYNYFVKKNTQKFFNKDEDEFVTSSADPLAKLYFVFSIKPFSYKLGGYSNFTVFNSEDFFELYFKWLKSSDFLVKEVPIIIEE
tara:strand:- start:210 stop:1067 length:858 start_codon:yes stop_codon:yes gene_type:complete